MFANPLVIILLVASAISAAVGEDADALIIVTLVVLGVATNFWHSYRSQQAVDRLRGSVMPAATVRRDGTWQEIPIRNVVPGDVFRLWRAIWSPPTHAFSSHETFSFSNPC